MKIPQVLALAAFSFMAAGSAYCQTEIQPPVVVSTVQQPIPATKADVKQQEQDLKRAKRDVSETRRDEREAVRDEREDKRELKQAIRDKREAARNKREDIRDREEYNERLQRPMPQPLQTRTDTLRN